MLDRDCSYWGCVRLLTGAPASAWDRGDVDVLAFCRMWRRASRRASKD